MARDPYRMENGLNSQSATTPACQGVFTTTVSVTYQAALYIKQPLCVSAGSLVLHDIPAFDKCTVPPLEYADLWTQSIPGYQHLWRNQLPSSCFSPNLNAAWCWLPASKVGLLSHW